MTRSPFLTVRGMRWPVSVLMAPVPTASTVPVLGRSLPVSGRKMPVSVLVWASSRRTMILSPRGRTLVLLLDLGAGLVSVLDMRGSPKGCRVEERHRGMRHQGIEAKRLRGPAAFVVAFEDAAEDFEEEVEVVGALGAVDDGEGPEAQ